MNDPQLKIDFVAWLRELYGDATIENRCWLEDSDGNESGDYCHDCAEKEVKKNLLAATKFDPCKRCKGEGKWRNGIDGVMEDCDDCYATGRTNAEDQYTEIAGDGGSAGGTDSQPFCEGCGAALLCSPSKDMIEEDIEWLADAEEIGKESALSIHEWLTGMGDYQPEKHWPMIEPHAKRLMTAAGREIVPAGKIRLCLADAIGSAEYYHVRKIEWTLAYQWLARKLLTWSAGNKGLECLILTSGINYYSFPAFTAEDQPHRCVAKLLGRVGEREGGGAFLASLGFNTRADLEKPFLIPDERFDWPALDVCGRKFKKPGPNSCHPEALTVTHATFGIGTDGLWTYELYYDFNHFDRSSWSVSLHQKKGQSLPKFVKKIETWTESLLEPDVGGSLSRVARIRDWDAARAGIQAVFNFDFPGEKQNQEVELTDLLAGSLNGGITDKKILLKEGNGRLETLKKWIEEDKAAKAIRDAEWEASRPRWR
jgi:hypothetical protein